MKVPEITLEDWKDYARRHDMKSEVPDEEAFAKALHNVYLREQAIEDQREANRLKHSSQSSMMVSCTGVPEIVGSTPTSGNLSNNSSSPTLSNSTGLKPSNKGELELRWDKLQVDPISQESGDQSRRVIDGGSTPSPGDIKKETLGN